MFTKKEKTKINKEYNFSKSDFFSFLMLLSLGLILPTFFLPFFSLSVSISKTVLVSIFVIASFFLWILSRLKDGKFLFPKSSILLAGAVVVLSFFLSSIFSDAPSVSFIGLTGEVGTFSSILILYLAMFLSSIYFQDKRRVFNLYFLLLLSASIIFVYQVLRFVFVGFELPLTALLNVIPQVMMGRWADTAIFFGLIAVLSLLTLELLNLNKKIRVVLNTSLALSLIVLFFVNMKLVWMVVGFFALVVFAYSISFGKKRKTDNKVSENTPFTAITVFVISLFFVLAGGKFGDSIYSFFNIPQDVLRPSFEQTMTVAEVSLSENLLFGAGPNRFVNEWLLFKPDDVNASVAWNLDFNAGSGVLPSFAITTGLIGILAWLIFLGSFLYSGIKSMFVVRLTEPDRYVAISSFVAALYLWIFSIFFISNIAILFLTFLTTGVFIAVLTQAKIIKNYNISFLEDPRIGFVSVLVLMLLVMASLYGGYTLFKKFLSVAYFQKTISAFNLEGNIEKSKDSINRAIRLNKNDLYYRTLSEINLSQLNIALGAFDPNDEQSQANLQAIYLSSINNAISAKDFDETNYLNWLFLAKVYESLIPIGDPSTLYSGAKESYIKALSLNPKSPHIELLQARLEIAVGNRDSAKEYVYNAISKKADYTEAIFLLSQIQADEGNVEEAISSAEAAAFVSPNNTGVFFQLGLLNYRSENYKKAISALERAVALNTNYANAKYFLGLSYDKEGQTEKALRQFEDIKILNPGNAEVEKILDNLLSGRSALSGVQSPIEDDELPVEEE